MTNKSDCLCEYVAGYVIEFTDGGNPEGKVLHRGTKEECQRCSETVNGISYSGDRPVKDGYFFVVPAVVYDTFQAGGGSA